MVLEVDSDCELIGISVPTATADLMPAGQKLTGHLPAGRV